MVMFYFPFLLLVSLLTVAFRHRPPAWSRSLYRGLLVLSILPYGLHVTNSVMYTSKSLTLSPGTYQGVFVYVVASCITILSLFSATMVLVRRVPLATPLLPVCAWFAYWYGCLPIIYRELEGVLLLDNIPNVWLFASSALSVVVLAGAALFTHTALWRGEPPNRPLQRSVFARR